MGVGEQQLRGNTACELGQVREEGALGEAASQRDPATCKSTEAREGPWPAPSHMASRCQIWDQGPQKTNPILIVSVTSFVIHSSDCFTVSASPLQPEGKLPAGKASLGSPNPPRPGARGRTLIPQLQGD